MTSEKKPLSSEDASRLLDLLSTDDGFRVRFERNPSSALAEISTEAGLSSLCCESAGPLASKEEFQLSRNRLLDFLASHASFYVPHCFVAGQVDVTMNRDPQA
ncbi:NHLP-related RiPP peptide [Stenotrophomonas tumulicola]|uniref:Putative modified peptide n=1 Tax=Stenotrophomonas tumulicola TaxID=1685415 RepID=A0A7W3FQ63_9GAMM|nr:NHLP-related RiPP peptide [Stenotrophomonas tumulicola]MBA8683709.1 putative modified peptide [Stenotrophomonas tumulicola]